MEGRRPTLEAVAAHAGVGRGTASRVINGSERVSGRAREAVLRAVEELGYVPNNLARGLVRRRTDTVALVMGVSEDTAWAEPYFSGLVRGIKRGLADSGLQLLLALAQSGPEGERLLRYLTAQHVDGVLLTSLRGDDPMPRRLEDSGIPTVVVGAPTGFDPAHCVDVDNRDGARRAVRHLLDRGRRRIATITGPQDTRAGLQRLQGFHDAHAAAVLDAGPVAHGDFSADSGVRAMQELLRRDPGIDAVFAASDSMAIGALRVLKERGRRVPGDVAVVGFDDSPIAVHTDPPLTSVHQPLEQMGREMTRILIARINGEAVARPRVVLDTRLVVRDST
ncbi:LacI family DNA-binding transcriptional regulator [Kitasatospora sp. NA04385]|uniref:LacI family DNA-binding transcriptional regulator n=1 Tax=Kitasatospora sp. NA04385 TaxID=2742135 RepID=UPI0015927685|nr:LacI family DNA-binding transcriptional regulator [Kitasatospora sp. NA04385]QKW23808.1 LacI family DNA-binding transcriptional regulator [Kitasatospora sp. NA04385]